MDTSGPVHSFGNSQHCSSSSRADVDASGGLSSNISTAAAANAITANQQTDHNLHQPLYTSVTNRPIGQHLGQSRGSHRSMVISFPSTSRRPISVFMVVACLQGCIEAAVRSLRCGKGSIVIVFLACSSLTSSRTCGRVYCLASSAMHLQQTEHKCTCKDCPSDQAYKSTPTLGMPRLNTRNATHCFLYTIPIHMEGFQLLGLALPGFEQ